MSYYLEEFVKLVHYTRSLKFADRPDYHQIKKAFKIILKKEKTISDKEYDWVKLTVTIKNIHFYQRIATTSSSPAENIKNRRKSLPIKNIKTKLRKPEEKTGDDIEESKFSDSIFSFKGKTLRLCLIKICQMDVMKIFQMKEVKQIWRQKLFQNASLYKTKNIFANIKKAQ